MTGKVEGIWVKRAVRGPMDSVAEVSLVADGGIDGDANAGRSSRQVTIIESEVFDRIRESLPSADPAMRRANFMISGIRLEGARDRLLTLGEARVLIKGETRPCERMDAQCPGLREALEPGWGGGAYGVVVQEGHVRLGDVATLGAAAPTE